MVDRSPLSTLSAVLALLVLGALGLMTLYDVVDGQGTARQERIAPTPTWPAAPRQIPKFLADARFHVTKRYALKDQLIAANAAVKLTLFGYSTAPNVMRGRQGFLFLGQDAPIGLVQGLNRLTEAGQARWARHFQDVHAGFASAHLPYALIVGPDKHGIYAEALPRWLRVAPPTATRTHQLMALATAHLGPGTLDTRTLLQAARVAQPDALFYHKTDTHWTELGASLAVFRTLQGMGLSASLPETILRRAPRSGDLARMMGRQAVLSERVPVLIGTGWSCRGPDGAELAIQTIDPLLPQRFTCGHPDGADTTLVVFHDSFGVQAVPYLAMRFRRVEFIWTDTANPDLARILGADAVLQILVERKLATDHPEAFFKSSS